LPLAWHRGGGSTRYSLDRQSSRLVVDLAHERNARHRLDHHRRKRTGRSLKVELAPNSLHGDDAREVVVPVACVDCGIDVPPE
jgi:hypothetical protein